MLSPKLRSFLDASFKSIIFFAILGCVVMFIGAKLLEKMFNDIIHEAASVSGPPPAQPAK